MYLHDINHEDDEYEIGTSAFTKENITQKKPN